MKSAQGLLIILASILSKSYGFTPALSAANRRVNNVVTCQATRRDIVSAIPIGVLSLLLPNLPALAEEDMASQMFNEDGSLKEGIEAEAKERLVQFSWDFSENLALSQDAKNLGDTKDGNQISLSYKYPVKWSDGKDGDEIYFDRTEGTNAKACKRVTVFQAPGKADMQRLSKATTVGVAKSVSAPESLGRLYQADIISGRIAKRNGREYYEFDMASAPESCGTSEENLGLGFCPYDNIFLLSATIVEERLYCIVVECDSTKIWKLESSALKRVRSSFTVEESASS